MNDLSITIKPYRETYREQVLGVWERSVRATHHFVTAEDIEHFKLLVAGIDFTAFDVFIAAGPGDRVAGFIGVAEQRIETLFLDPPFIGKGIGKLLMDHAMGELQAKEVEVNEQNLHAVAFYKKFGFRTYKRTEKDGEGKDYPLLKMRLERD
jgi:putative acetyltransferase